METLIYKNLSEVKEVDEGIIIGYANVYNVKDSDGDISLPGSFSKTVVERQNKIRIFKNHSPLLVGVPTEFDLIDPYGLKMTAKMLMTTPLGKDTFEEVKFLVANGYESGLSIGGWVVKRSTKNAAEVVEYKLKEVSVLTTNDPANEQSLINTVKSARELTDPSQEEFWELIEKAYDNEKFNDKILQSLEKFLTLKNKEPESIDKSTLDIKPSQSQIILNIYNQISKKL